MNEGWFLDHGLKEAEGDTYPRTFAKAKVSGFKAQQVDNRDSASWKKATHIIVDPPSQSSDHNDVVNGFVKIAKKDPKEDFLQVLYYTEDGLLYNLYDAEGYKIGDGDLNSMYGLAEDFLCCRSKCNFVQRKFYNWLIRQPASRGAGGTFAPGMAKRYCDCLRSYLGDVQFSNVGIRNVFEVISYSDFQSLNAATGPIRSVTGFASFDASHFKGAFSAALNRYEEFLRTPEGKRLQVMNKNMYQRIFYGAPGTGKSFGIVEKFPDEVVFRTTFHPDSDYSTFVGAYKPTMKKIPRIVQDGTALKKPNYAADIDDALKVEEKISYEFRPQAFMNAYVTAWKEMVKGAAGKPIILVIEEINRGNCAQIFGDIFQLLDRDDATGWSSYPIDADTDLANWLKAVREKKADGTDGDLIFGAKLDAIAKPTKIKDSDWADIKKGKKLALPPNLYIWATMNTSDQSLFPIDSAFKRRWEWKYVPIREGKYKDGEKKGQRLGWTIKFTVPAHQDENGQQVAAKNYIYDWWKFLLCINKKIYKTTESEDKKLGYFFLKPDGEDATTHDGTISGKRFVGKVIFYLWNDVFKDYGIENLLKNEDIGKKDDDEKGQGVAFEEFFSEDSDEVNPQVLVAFFKAIGLEPESSRPAEGGEVVASESETGTAASVIADAPAEEQPPTE